MVMFVFRRIGQIVASLIAILVITFYLMHAAPGDFFNIERLMNQQVTGSRLSQFEEKSQTLMLWEERYGENTPVWKQILIYLRHAAALDFGPSFRYPDTTIEEMMTRAFPRTFVLAFSPMLLALLIGIPMGIGAALYRNTWIDRATMFVSMLGICIPSYVIALLVIVFFAVTLQLFPTSGWGTWEYAVLPVLAMVFQPVAGIRPVRQGKSDQGNGRRLRPYCLLQRGRPEQGRVSPCIAELTHPPADHYRSAVRQPDGEHRVYRGDFQYSRPGQAVRGRRGDPGLPDDHHIHTLFRISDYADESAGGYRVHADRSQNPGGCSDPKIGCLNSDDE